MATLRRGVTAMVLTCTSLLTGCAIYHSKPLPTGPDLARSPALTVPVTDLGIPGLEPEPFDPAKGLTEANVVTLAVLDNPRLKAVRRQAGVARAQLLEAGVIPNPRVSGGLAKSPLFTGYRASLGEDIRALITRGAAKGAARAHLEEVNLDILWQEWQVASRARELYIQARTLGELGRILQQRRTLLATLYARDESSLKQGFVTAGAVTPDFAAWNSAETEWRALELEENHTRHALDELLGLAPDVELRLRGTLGEHPLTAAQYRSALAALPQRRPDLLALQAGYHSQEEQLREAILAQFPLIDAGVEKARDPVENIGTVGFNVTLTLPLFDRNQGPIAAGRASRAYLYQAYQASLDETTNQADQVWNAVVIMQHQLETLDERHAGLEQAAAAAKESLQRGTSSLPKYSSMENDALAAQAEEIRLRASLEQGRAVLATLLVLAPRGAGVDESQKGPG